MTKRITCDCCGKDLTGQAHLSLSTHNAHPDSWGDPIEGDFCNIYQCLRDWMAAQSLKYGWARPEGKIAGQTWPENGAVMDGE